MPPGASADTAAMAHVNMRNMDAVIFSKSVGDDRLGPYGYDGLRDCVYEQRRRQSGQRERNVALGTELSWRARCSAPFDTVEVPEFIWSPRALANVQ